MVRLGLAFCLLLSCAPALAEPLAGHWQGTMTRDGASLPLSFDFNEDGPAAGRFTSATQRAMDYPLDSVTRAGHDVHFVLGGQTSFDGTLEGRHLSGTFKDDDGDGRFDLQRAPKPPLPYRFSQVTFTNGAVTLSGSLAIPPGKGPHPAVVLLQGSGPETRWGTNRYIADRFARAGIATLIYDKRGSGQSGGDWRTASYDDLAGDALAAADLLSRRHDIDARRIGLHGHSQGGIVAADATRLAAGKIAFIVAEDTVAGPIWQQDLYRVKNALAHDFPPDQAAAAFALYGLFIDVARGLKPYNALAAAEADAKAAKAPWLDWLSLPPRDSWLWPWYLKTGTVDTIDYWRTVGIPTLIIYGQRDRLVPADESISGIERALDVHGAAYTALIVPQAEHNLTIHPQPGQAFFWWHGAPGLIDLVAAWISAKPGQRQ